MLTFPVCLVALAAAAVACPLHGAASNFNYASADRVLEHAQSRRSPVAHRTAIKNARVFNGHAFTDPQTVIFDNGVIVASHLEDNADVEVDGTGKYLIPGLIDSHIHIDNVETLELLSSYGITTGMNMVCYNYTVCSALAQMTGVTQFMTATQAAIKAGTANPFLAPPSDKGIQPGANITQWVADQFFHGSPAEWLKVVASPDDSGLTQAQMSQLTIAAHSIGTYSVTHATYLAAYAKAITSKTDIIQHTPGDKLLSQSLIQQILKNGQAVTPTMSVFRVGTNSHILQQILRQGANNTANFTTVTANVRAMHEAGVPLLAGTDCAEIPSMNISMPYGLAIHCELEFLVEAGLNASEALRAATVVPAKRQGMDDRGVIAPGMRADLLLLNSNPLINISNTRDIAKVWAGGVEAPYVTRNFSKSCAALDLVSI